MNNIESWLKELDKIKKVTQPFGKHIASYRLSEHEIGIYTLLHVALVSASGSISKNQERLYEFYLPSISPKLKLSELLSLAQNFSGKELEKSIETLKVYNLTLHFLLDALIFMRLDGIVSSEVRKLLDGFCQSMKVTESDIKQVVYLSDKIFNVKESNQPELDLSFDDLISNNTWVEFFSKTINKNNISKISNGIWRIEESIESYEGDIEWENCIIIFGDKGKIYQCNGNFRVDKSMLIKPDIEMKGVRFGINDSKVKGVYVEKNRSTSFLISSTDSIDIVNTSFATVNARTFSIDSENHQVNIDSCSFHNCGNKKLLGGAFYYLVGPKFKSCNFVDCVAYVGGAIFAKLLTEKSFDNCLIKRCESEIEWDDSINAGGMYFYNEEQRNNIYNSKIETNFSIFKMFSSSGASLTVNSILQGVVCYGVQAWSCGGSANFFDENGMKLNGLNSSSSLNKEVGVKEWGLLHEECNKL